MAIGQINPMYQGIRNECRPYFGLFFTAVCIGTCHVLSQSTETTDERSQSHNRVALGDAHLFCVAVSFIVSTIFYSIIGRRE